jgi:hypothetical protein
MRMKQIISKKGVLAIIERLKKQRLKSIIYIIVTNIFVVQSIYFGSRYFCPAKGLTV